MLIDSFRSHTLTVERRDRISDGAHGWTEAFASVGTVTGSLQPGSAADTHVAEAGRAVARWVLFLDPSAPIAGSGGAVQRDDELTYGPSRFRVIDVLDWAAGSTVDHARLDLEQVQRGT